MEVCVPPQSAIISMRDRGVLWSSPFLWKGRQSSFGFEVGILMNPISPNQTAACVETQVCSLDYKRKCNLHDKNVMTSLAFSYKSYNVLKWKIIDQFMVRRCQKYVSHKKKVEIKVFSIEFRTKKSRKKIHHQFKIFPNFLQQIFFKISQIF